MSTEAALNATLKATWKASTRRHLTYPQHISGWEARHYSDEQARFGTEQIMDEVEDFFSQQGEFIPEIRQINSITEEVNNQ